MTGLNRTFFSVDELVRFYFSCRPRVSGHVSVHSAGKQNDRVPEHFSVTGFGGRIFEIFELLSRFYVDLVVECVNFFANSHQIPLRLVFGTKTVAGRSPVSPVQLKQGAF